jgi:hypothetical protein
MNHRYMVEVSHTPRECVWALKRMLEAGPEFLARFDWGCKDGDHTGWAVLDAESKFEIQELVPQVMRAKARIVQLNEFTPEEVEAFHDGLAQASS